MSQNNEKSKMGLAIAISLAILLGWQYFQGETQKKRALENPPQTAEGTVNPGLPTAPSSAAAQPGVPGAPGVPEGQAAAPQALSPEAERQAALEAGPRLQIDTPRFKGSIALKGARLDDLLLIDYRETTAPDSPYVSLLKPGNGIGAYYADFGWVSEDKTLALPGPDTVWHTQDDTLTPERPVRLVWDNGQGLRFIRTLSVDADYMFTVSQTVENYGTASVTLYPYGLMARVGTPHTSDFYILHEGAVGVFDGTLQEVKYKALREDDHRIESKGNNGWVGFSDKYWLTALAPNQGDAVTLRMSWYRLNATDRYQTDWMGQAVTVAPGTSGASSGHLFAGAKVLSLLNAYADQYKLPLFDRAIDFGWFWFLTIPFFYCLRFIHQHVGNFGIAILIFTVMVKLAFFPIANKSYRSMNKMKKLQPEVKRLQELYSDDKQRMNQEVMALYKREKANPVSGCLPILIQIPVFFALYKVLYVTIEMRQAPFYGWIHDLSAPDPTSLFNLFGLIPWAPPAMLMIGAWPVLMGLTMWLQQKLNPAPADPMQAKIFMFLPFIFTFMLAQFPAGLVIYWAWNNILSIGQQWLIMKQADKA